MGISIERRKEIERAAKTLEANQGGLSDYQFRGIVLSLLLLILDELDSASSGDSVG